MGDGKKLKEYLDEKGTNVRRIAKETGISATTLYTIIQKDSNIRFDFALRLANALDIDVNEICSQVLSLELLPKKKYIPLSQMD
jgi:transcriptional regulator with XRE-family HTH domain